ncbi:hypothetical protein JCM10207_006970 [Rhodosporidiobolus poonsookiae]
MRFPGHTKDSKCESRKLRTVETQDTQSSKGSGSSDTPSSPRSSKFSFSSLHDAVSRGSSKRGSHSEADGETGAYHLEPPTDPVHLVETAIALVLTVPGPPLRQLRDELIPRLYHKAYSHRVNCREHGIEDLIKLVTRFRERFLSVRLRFRSHLMDMDGTADMHAAAVAITYDIIAVPHPAPGQSKHDVHEKRGSAVGVHKIYEGRLAQTDLVVDTVEFQPEHEGPQLEQCVVM